MTKAQWKAIYDYCEEYSIPKSALLKELKENGTVSRDTTLEELGDYPESATYDAMIKFLEENL